MRCSSDIDGRRGPCGRRCGRRWSARSRRSSRRWRRMILHHLMDIPSAQRAGAIATFATEYLQDTLETKLVMITWQDPRVTWLVVTENALVCQRVFRHDANLTAVIVPSRIGRGRICIPCGSRRRSRCRGAQSRWRSRSVMSPRRSAQSAEYFGAPCSPDARWSDC